MNELTDEQKSVMLARLCGWKAISHPLSSTGGYIIDQNLKELAEYKGPLGIYRIDGLCVEVIPNLYDPANMALAWRVLNWVWRTADSNSRWPDWMFTWFDNLELHKLPPAEAQRAWLDKVLQLATEAGMVEA